MDDKNIKNTLYDLLNDVSLDIYQVVLMARKDLENNEVQTAIGRLKVDVDKFCISHPSLFKTIINMKRDG